MEGLEERGGPITIARAEGVYLEDTEGRRDMDLMAGAGNVILGHSAESVKQALREQLDQVCYALQAAYANVPAIKLSKALAEITPGDLNTTFFVCNGSDANETAIKIARQYFANRGERRFKVISRSANSYQGCHLTTLSTSGTLARRVMFHPLTATAATTS
jgi:adenosylmethionine-8-amino-7-oxononanoate aminotransferase